ncbi:hypothetical protein QR680_017397 [Steinernema hermaphroditum]|uniref:Tyr recombinase domain-containing protein n=1 Tax=Steinernema hermaphroditum TaxID=289476 RepID=A0AA39LPA8_9BILA|nr:hypothetical protein QR680_017397 [Steinernema hermaphroditum]
MLEGIRREGKLPEHRAKISETELRLLARWQVEDIKDRRILTLLAVLYAGCLRPSEGTLLRRCNVNLSIDKMVLSIVKDKTNKEGSARKVIVQAAPNRFCAVNLMSIWLQRAPNSPYVFPNLNESSRPMSYAVARQEWIRIASKLDIPSNITLHGLRGGAATQAIADGAPVDEVMRHGRWKRVETLKAYVEASEKTTPVASALLKRMRLGPDMSSHDETGKAKDSVRRRENSN